jgi:hypothetical protein
MHQVQSMPIKFRTKSEYEADVAMATSPSEGALAPPPMPSAPLGLEPGSLCVVPTIPVAVGRVLGQKQQKLMIAFFTPGFKPSYVPQEIVRPLTRQELADPNTVSVDSILAQVLWDAHNLIAEISQGWEGHRDILVLTLHCAIFLQILRFVGSHVIPPHKVQKLLSAIDASNPFRFMSGKRVYDQFKILVRETLQQVVAC